MKDHTELFVYKASYDLLRQSISSRLAALPNSTN